MSVEKIVSAEQVLKRLAQIEDDGVRFYEALKRGTASDKVRSLASMLIKAEMRHRDRFLEYARRAHESSDPNDATPAGPLPVEAARLLDADIFIPEKRIEESAKYARDIEIINLAIRIEESAALLLTSLQSFVPKNQRAYIVRVIKEEWQHKAKLEEVRKQFFM